MVAFTLCAGLGAGLAAAAAGPQRLLRAADNWRDLGLEQLLVGEGALPESPLRLRITDVATNAADEPCLADLLRCAAAQARHAWLLLVSPDVLISHAMLASLDAALALDRQPRLLLGRTWRLGDEALARLAPADLESAIDAAGCLDPPDRPGWVLLPRGVLLAAPPQLGCDPAEAIPWLAAAAAALGWPLFDATAVAPSARPAAVAFLPPPAASYPLPTPLWPHQLQPGRKQPRLSLLLAASETQLDCFSTTLLPAPSLPWEVIARPADPTDEAGAVAAAWNSALAVAEGELVWPITAPPPLALLPVVLRRFEQSAVDLLQLAWQLGDQLMPLHETWHQEPGCLVMQTAWLRRVGGLQEDRRAAQALLAARRQAEARGACPATLPLIASRRSSTAVSRAV